MAQLFRVDLPKGMSSVKLDSQGRATVQYTVKNLSARKIDGRAVLVWLSQGKSPAGTVEKGWATIETPDRSFDLDKEETYTVKILVPPKSPVGNYAFRLDAVSIDKPDEGDSGPSVAFTVAAPSPSTSNFPLWVIPVVLLVVIGLGVGLWLALRPSGNPVPDLHGKTLSEADDILKKADLTLDQNNVQTAESKAEDSDKIIKQTPDAGQKASKGQAVKVTVGAEMVAVPQLIGVPYNQVLGILSGKKLVVGQTTIAPNPSFTGAVVWNQTPSAQQEVKTGTTVNLTVTPEMVTVPNVIGQTLGNAILGLRGLTVASFSGDHTKTVISQNPPGGASVPVGSPVTLAFPFIPCFGGVNCIYQGIFAQRLAMQRVGIAIRELEQQKEAPPK